MCKLHMIVLQDGDPTGDKVAAESGENLLAKPEARSAITGGVKITDTLDADEKDYYNKLGKDKDAKVGFTIKPGNPEVLAKIGEKDKMYLVAHGSDDGVYVAGLSGKGCAKWLADRGLKNVGKISIVACHGGGALTPAQRGTNEGLQAAFASFAGELHAALKEDHGVPTEVLARCAYTGVQEHETPEGRTYSKGLKKTRFAGRTDYVRRQPNSKISFSWEGDQQSARFVLYKPK